MFAGPLSEEDVVRAMISAAREDRLEAFLKTADLVRISSNPRFQWKPEHLLPVVRSLDLQDVSFEASRLASQRVVRVTNTSGFTVLFTLEPIAKTTKRPEGGLVVVAVDILHAPN